MKKVGWIGQTKVLVYTSLIGQSSRRRPSMAGTNLSPLWSHSVCEFRLNRSALILVPHMAPYNPLPQTVGAETVSPEFTTNSCGDFDSLAALSACFSWFPYMPPCHSYPTSTTDTPFILKCSETATKLLQSPVSLLYSAIIQHKICIARKTTSDRYDQQTGYYR